MENDGIRHIFNVISRRITNQCDEHVRFFDLLTSIAYLSSLWYVLRNSISVTSFESPEKFLQTFLHSSWCLLRNLIACDTKPFGSFVMKCGPLINHISAQRWMAEKTNLRNSMHGMRSKLNVENKLKDRKTDAITRFVEGRMRENKFTTH